MNKMLPGNYVQRRTLAGGLADGVECLDVDNGAIRFTVLPTRGMGIHRVSFPDGRPVGWRSPILGPVHPKFVNLADASGLGWLDGFDEFLCRCGLESNGAPEFDEAGRLRYPLHGKIANRPAHSVEATFDDERGEIAIAGEVAESRFLVQNLRLTTTIRTRPGEAGFRIRDEVTNLRGVSSEMQLLYHINFGPPVLEAGARAVLPVRQVVPRNEHAASDLAAWDQYRAEQAGFTEQVYFFELAADADGMTETLLRNAAGTLGASLRFNVRHLPCFTLWKNTVAQADGYVTGLEPGTNFPNPRSFEKQHGRVVSLAPGETRTFDLALDLHSDANAIAAAEDRINRLRQSAPPKLHPAPRTDWCA